MGLKKTVLQVTVLHHPEIDVEGMSLTGLEEAIVAGEFLAKTELQYTRLLEPSEEKAACAELGDDDGEFADKHGV